MHLVWTTLGRQPLLEGAARSVVYDCIRAKCEELSVAVIAFNGVEDHVHLFVQMPPTLCVSELAKHVKGASSHTVRDRKVHEGFGWQDGYSAFTVSRWDVPKIAAYIEQQQAHHRDGTCKDALEP
jgi:REP element-mobilizing transposase RayT